MRRQINGVRRLNFLRLRTLGRYRAGLASGNRYSGGVAASKPLRESAELDFLLASFASEVDAK